MKQGSLLSGLVTANIREDYLAELRKLLDLRLAGRADRVGGLLGEEELIRELAETDVFIVGYDQVTARVIANAPALKLIASIRGGPEANVDIDAATAAGIAVLRTIGRTEHAVAEYAFLLMLALARPLLKAERQLREGVLLADGSGVVSRDVIWPLDPESPAAAAHAQLFGGELYAKTLGIVGFGNIGRAVARLARAFGMRVLVFDPFSSVEDADVEQVGLDALVAESDYVTLHARVNESTVGLIGERELRAMKPTACLVNTARAALVEEAALIHALQNGWIRGAALDVFHREPLSRDDALLVIDRDRLVLSPHLAGSTFEVESHHSRLLAADILRYLEGARPEALANPEVFERPGFDARGGRAFGVIGQGTSA